MLALPEQDILLLDALPEPTHVLRFPLHTSAKLVYSRANLAHVITHIEMVEWEMRDPDFVFWLRTDDGQLFDGRIGRVTEIDSRLKVQPTNPLVFVHQRQGYGRQGLRPVLEFTLPKSHRLFPLTEWNKRIKGYQ